jgi:hypothetical protein
MDVVSLRFLDGVCQVRAAAACPHSFQPSWINLWIGIKPAAFHRWRVIGRHGNAKDQKAYQMRQTHFCHFFCDEFFQSMWYILSTYLFSS